MTTDRTPKRLDSIDQRLAALLTVAEQQQENISALGHTAEVLVDGMGQFLEGMTELKATVQRQVEVAERQSASIERLANVAEQLVQELRQ